MAKASISEGKLQVSLSLFQAIRALQPSFEIPMSSIRGATEDTNYIRSGLGIRAPGTGFPGLVAEGTFYKDGLRTLSLWRRGQEVVVLELANSKWDRLLLGCDDSKKLAALINAALNR